MSPAQFAVWTYARQVSYGSGIFYADVRATAAQFRSIGKSSIHRVVQSLEEEGWFKVIRPSLREKNGKYSCAQYRVLDHDEWALEHPDQCVACPKTELRLSRTWDEVLEKKYLKREEKNPPYPPGGGTGSVLAKL
jgi:hypothetical protein